MFSHLPSLPAAHRARSPSPAVRPLLYAGCGTIPPRISTVPEFVDSFFSGIYKTSFICQLCQETNIYYEPFHHITVQPNTDIFAYLAKDFRENKNLTCRKCTTQSCQSLRTSYQETPNILLIQINRFSVSNLHGRPRKNNHPFGIYENIKLGLINYTLLGLIEKCFHIGSIVV